MPLIPAEGSRGWQISEFKASLVFRAGSRTARAAHKETLSQNNNKQPDRQRDGGGGVATLSEHRQGS